MIGSGHCLSVNAENLTTIFVLSGIFCFCVYPVSSNYTACKRFYGRTPPPPNGGPPRTERSPLPCGHLPTPWGVTPFRGGNIETPAPENTRISTSQIQARATTGVGKPQADSEGNERIPPDGFDMAALEHTQAVYATGSPERGAGSRRLTEGFLL